MSEALAQEEQTPEMLKVGGLSSIPLTDNIRLASRVEHEDWNWREFYSQPAFLGIGKKWFPLEGLVPPVLAFSYDDTHLVACGDYGGNVYRLSDGKRLLHSETETPCPALWSELFEQEYF